MVLSTLSVASRQGDYEVDFSSLDDPRYRDLFRSCRGAIVDGAVWDHYGREEGSFGALEVVVVHPVAEESKTVATCISFCERLLNSGWRREDTLLAVGGGVIQDLATFTASILFRGVTWFYVPTTLLSQADSCIGGKSSLNLGPWKNQLGNFHPPRKIHIVPEYLNSLPEVQIRSGLGEILKVHLLSGPQMVHRIDQDYPRLGLDPSLLTRVIERSLRLKAEIIRSDEFDRGQRLTLNYGHSFGHALEAAADFKMAHGIAVTFGMDLANYLAWRLGRVDGTLFDALHRILGQNLRRNDWVKLDPDRFLRALRHDKKNRGAEYRFVLPSGEGRVELFGVPMRGDIEGMILERLGRVEEWLE
ncbi:MAG: 3-dehydroquinate synthase [Acidobacteriota bacterium]